MCSLLQEQQAEAPFASNEANGNSKNQPLPFTNSSWNNLQIFLEACVTDEVIRRRDAVQRELGHPYIGLHVRLTDLVSSKVSRGKNVGEFPENYISRVLRYTSDSSQQVYLATDSLDGLVGICRACELNIHHLPRDRFQSSGHRRTANSDALVDLLLLSESSYLVGTRGSSFTETAIKLGGQPYSLVS